MTRTATAAHALQRVQASPEGVAHLMDPAASETLCGERFVDRCVVSRALAGGVVVVRVEAFSSMRTASSHVATCFGCAQLADRDRRAASSRGGLVWGGGSS